MSLDVPTKSSAPESPTPVRPHESSQSLPGSPTSSLSQAASALSALRQCEGNVSLGGRLRQHGAANPVLALQRQAGNAAVAALVRTRRGSGPFSASSAPTVQRWIGSEHRDIGDASGGQDVDLGNGVLLTWGQVIAIAGDEYPDIDALRADAKSNPARIRAALEHAEVLDARTAGLPEPSEAEKKAHVADYIGLLLTNVQHFAEGGAIDRWRDEHSKALGQALNAGIAGRPADLEAARATEAFGEHFLTDAFSGGHVRTPRKAISDWYVGTFAPKVADAFVGHLKARLVSEITGELYAQTGGVVPPGVIYQLVDAKANELLANAMAKIGGHDGFVRYFGLAIAGGVSGALHDMEGERGVWVASKAHPAAFQAFGDTRLADPRNATNRAQAILAVQAAQADLNTAYLTGEQEAASPGSATAATDLPQVVYFAFDSSALTAASSISVANAGGYMSRHPETRVELTGHADPTGAPAYNRSLGMRRAEAVAAVLMKHGADPTRIKTDSAGAEQLVTKNPKQLNLDRRTEFRWMSAPGNVEPGADQPVERAHKALVAAVGPPYKKVENLVPHPVEEMSGASANVELEDWHWGSMPPKLVAGLDQWTREHLGPYVGAALANVPEVESLGFGGLSVHPRPAVKKSVDDLLANPTTFLGNLFGQPPGK